MKIATLVPAYGRTYNNKKTLQADFNNGRDFMMVGFHGAGYINREGLAEAGFTEANVRYGPNGTKVCVCKVTS